MSLEKSPQSAAVMAAVTVLSAFLGQFLLGYLRTIAPGFGAEGNLAGPSLAGVPWGTLLFGLGIVLFFPFVVLWYVIGRLSSAHYGRGGLVRWGLVGFTWALLLNIVIQLTEPLAGSTSIGSVFTTVMELAMIPLSYYLVFRVFSTWRGRHGKM